MKTSLHLWRLPSLDGLRGIAILAVLAHNLQLMQSPQTPFGRALEETLDRGWIGVQLFFVLSGFLITGILLDTRESPSYFRNFFARRALRIFPLYYVSLVVLLVLLPMLGLVAPPAIPNASQQWSYWLYLSNWTQPDGYHGGIVTHFWSLAVEEQFYLLWPFLVRRRDPRGVLGLCVGVALLALLVRLWLMHQGASPDALYMYSVSRMDALALGGAAAAAVRMPEVLQYLERRPGRLVALAVLMLLAGTVLTRGFPRLGAMDQTFGYGLLSLTLMVLVLAGAVGDLGERGVPGARGSALAAFLMKLLRLKPLRVFGKYSYGIYVLHKPLNDLVGAPIAHRFFRHDATDAAPTVLYLCVITLVSLGLAMLSYRWIEMPFLSLKSRFTDSSSDEPRLSPAAPSPGA